MDQGATLSWYSNGCSLPCYGCGLPCHGCGGPSGVRGIKRENRRSLRIILDQLQEAGFCLNMWSVFYELHLSSSWATSTLQALNHVWRECKQFLTHLPRKTSLLEGSQLCQQVIYYHKFLDNVSFALAPLYNSWPVQRGNGLTASCPL